MDPRQSLVHLVELVKLYLAPSTRALGSTRGRILLKNIESVLKNILRLHIVNVNRMVEDENEDRFDLRCPARGLLQPFDEFLLLTIQCSME